MKKFIQKVIVFTATAVFLFSACVFGASAACSTTVQPGCNANSCKNAVCIGGNCENSTVCNAIRKSCGIGSKCSKLFLTKCKKSSCKPTTKKAKAKKTTLKTTKNTVKATQKSTTVAKTTATKATSQNSSSVSAVEKEVVTLVNQIRKENGLSELKLNEKLCSVARVKAEDMAINGYFSHTSPTYGSPFDMMKKFGVSYKTAGENIAKGYTTAKTVVGGWMNSEGHRANILNKNYTEIGVGYTKNGNLWSQMFIG